MKHKARYDLEITTNIADADYIVTANASGYSDPGQCSGPIETSYPPECECELTDIRITPDGHDGPELDFSSLSTKIQDSIMDALDAKFFETLEDDCGPEYDLD